MIKDWYTQHEGKWHQIEDVQDTGIPAHKPGGGNKVKLKGKDKWVHASEVKGLEPKPPMKKSEAITKLKGLAKGDLISINKKKNPFNEHGNKVGTKSKESPMATHEHSFHHKGRYFSARPSGGLLHHDKESDNKWWFKDKETAMNWEGPKDTPKKKPVNSQLKPTLDAFMGLAGAKPPMKKSEAIAKLKSLSKGSAQRRMPFNPDTDITPQDRVTTESWTSGHYDTPRSEVPQLEGNAKQRGMHKLHKLTQSRKNPKTGEREFLLYRGKTVSDHNAGGLEERSSFTPDPQTAIGFSTSINRALLYNPASDIFSGEAKHHAEHLDTVLTREGKLDYAKKHLNGVYRAWVPESAIHHIPNAIGSKSKGLFELHRQLDTTKKPLRHEEHEVIVNTKGLSDIKEHTIEELPDYKKETRRDRLRERLNEYLRSKGKMKKSELSKSIPGKHSDAIRQVADSYAEGKGLSLNHDFQPPKVDPNHASNIAQAYHDMKHDPHHPEVKQAYSDLINETADQFKHIVNNTGIKISRMSPGQENPYKTSKALFDDIKNNNHMWYYPTDSGFGSDDNKTSDHPLMQDVDIDGKSMKANDLFRVVHDIFGHAKEGFSFGPEGEERAWSHHMQMYSPSAQRALTSETRGQNSWVNFGPHGENNRKDPANTIYAEQKAGLLPDWAHGPATPNKPITKSEAIAKLKELSKGDKKKDSKPFHGYNKNKHSKEGGLNDKARKKMNRETGSNLKRPVTSKKPKGEAKGRKASFCARMSGVKGPTSKNGKKTPKGAALDRWNCNKEELEIEKKADNEGDRCWEGYKPTPGKKPYTKGSCMKKSEAITKLKELSKGSAQRRMPFNPRSEESVESFKGSNKPREWIHGHLSQDSRASWPRIDGNARQRALHKLSGMTEVKKDPETGKRSFLLHRGVSPGEKNKYVNEETNTTSHKGITSWTPDHSVATQFSNDPNANHTLSTWVHEDDIHAVPFQTGTHYFQGKKHSHEGLSRRLKDEKEILVDMKGNHRLEDPDVAFKAAIPHSNYDSLEGETTRPVQANDGYFDDKEFASLNTRINQKMKKSEAIAKLKELSKGSAQRRMPFNPTRDVHDDEANKILSWQEDEEHDAKEQIKPMTGNLRQRALHRLHGMTESRIHPETGEKEFLLHRGITDSNEELGLGDYPSFTTHKDVAADFASTNTIGDTDVISSWVPESRIHHVPKMIGRFGQQSFHPEEGEVIVDNTGGHIDHRNGRGIDRYTDSRKFFRDRKLKPPKNFNERMKAKLTPQEAIQRLRELKKPV